MNVFEVLLGLNYHYLKGEFLTHSFNNILCAN